MPDWVTRAWTDYAGRMPRACRLELREIPLASRGRGAAEEGERMLATIKPDERVIALEVGGQSWNTEELSRQLARWLQDGRDVSFLVGGPDGLSPACGERASRQWSLSPLTFPHAIVRILVAEQLYRAWTILQNHPYHRA